MKSKCTNGCTLSKIVEASNDTTNKFKMTGCSKSKRQFENRKSAVRQDIICCTTGVKLKKSKPNPNNPTIKMDNGIDSKK